MKWRRLLPSSLCLTHIHTTHTQTLLTTVRGAELHEVAPAALLRPGERAAFPLLLRPQHVRICTYTHTRLNTHTLEHTHTLNKHSWRPIEAACDAPEEPWDEEEEATLKFNEDFSRLQPGDWVDVLCERNNVCVC